MKINSMQKTGAFYGGQAVLAASKQMRAIVRRTNQHKTCQYNNRLER